MPREPKRTRSNRRYVVCAGCGCDVLERDAIDIGLNPTTQEHAFFCEDCDDAAEEDDKEE